MMEMYRTLINFHMHIHDYYLIRIPGWDGGREFVRLPVKDVPSDIQGDEYAFCYATIGAESMTDLRFDRWEKVPPLKYVEAATFPGTCFNCGSVEDEHIGDTRECPNDGN